MRIRFNNLREEFETYKTILKMSNTVKNILVVVLGILIGGAINAGLVSLTNSIIPLPSGVDPNDLQSINENIHRYTSQHFIIPIIAHALGVLVASFIIAKFAASHNRKLALIPGFLFLFGGITMSVLLDAPLWVEAVDLLIAYLPMAWLGYILGRNKN